MKVATNTLAGAALNWAVLQIEVAEGRFTIDPEDHTSGLHYVQGGTVFGIGFIREHESPSPKTGKRFVYHGPSCGRFEPSSDWAWGGPIIERELLKLCPRADGWLAYGSGIPAMHAHYGPTALVAAMRCLVSWKLGDEVDVPEELLA